MSICFGKLLYLKSHPNFCVFVIISATHYCNSSRGYKYRMYGVHIVQSILHDIY